MSRAPLAEYHQKALEVLGPQNWWPGETPFEVCVGAILTQNTSWKNVEKAIANLKKNNVLDPHQMHALPPEVLAEMIRPAGYFNIKTLRLKNFLKFLIDEYEGSLEQMFSERLSTLREKILSVKGIGPETADSILLYAGQKPSFVVDAYTKRIFLRHQLALEEDDYYALQSYCTDHLEEDVQIFNELHAQIVAIGKTWCRPKEPNCAECPWKDFLP